MSPRVLSHLIDLLEPALPGATRFVTRYVQWAGIEINSLAQCGIKYQKAIKATKAKQEEEKKSIQSRMSMNSLLNDGEEDGPS